MKLEFVAGGCGGVGCADKTCPTVYRTDRGTFVVQGTQLSREESAELVFGANELAVELPEAVIWEAVHKLRSTSTDAA